MHTCACDREKERETERERQTDRQRTYDFFLALATFMVTTTAGVN